MISFYNGQITDILPNNLKATPDVQALSYAVKEAMQKLQEYAMKSRVYAAIQDLTDKILDTLAVELRVQYYSEDLPLDTKRNIIQNTMLWYRYAGTPSAVEELVSTVFGIGTVTEWFNFAGGPGTPGTFTIETSAALTPDILAFFNVMIKKVKNTRSHLSRIDILSDIQEMKYYAAGIVSIPKVIIRDSGL